MSKIHYHAFKDINNLKMIFFTYLNEAYSFHDKKTLHMLKLHIIRFHMSYNEKLIRSEIEMYISKAAIHQTLK